MRANAAKRGSDDNDILVKAEFRAGYRRVGLRLFLYGFWGLTTPRE